MTDVKPKITILEIRARNKLNQKEFGKTVGVTAQTVSSWEKNIKSISAGNLIKVCQIYGIKASDLLGT
nr:MAG TPA: helix-turn-helix domain protein [Caudoviricetes sp.]